MIDFNAIMEKHSEIRRRTRAIETLREKSTNTAVKMSDMPRGGGDGKRMESDVVNIVTAEESRDRAREELRELLRPLRKEMRRLRKWQHREVLKRRYVQGMTIEGVCDAIGYGWSQTNRYLREAEDIVQKWNSME